MEVLHIVTFIGLSMEIPTLLAMNCHEEMNYHERYSYGYDIFCTNLNNSNIDELRSVTVYNEIKLMIDNSNLGNLSANFFDNIPKTREIIITDTKLNFEESNISAFENLYQLELLSITNGSIKNISRDFFKGLDNLRALNISNNRLGVLKNGTLRNVENLEKLDLSHNEFRDLNNIPLCEVHQLKRLFLHHNRLTSLKNSSIACLKLLRTLSLDFNQIKELVSLKRIRYLGEVSLAYNKLESINRSFEGLENLQVLNLEGNHLKAIRSNHFRGVVSLQKLHLNDNLLNFISPDAFENLTALEELSLQNNNLSYISMLDLPSLKKLTLSNNTLLLTNREFKNLHNLQSLSLNRCNIGKLAKEHFQYLNYLEILDLSHNKVILDGNSFYGLHSLTQLLLVGNSLTTLPKYAFQFVTNLKILDLSRNRLKSLTNLTFHNLKNLEILNLSYNGLEILDENVLQPLVSLRSLDLEGNRLQYIDYDYIITQLTNLKLINIRENKLPCEFLSRMLHYFGSKKINFTVNEKLSFNEENVAGIPCQEYNKLNSSLKQTNSMLLKDNKVLNDIYHIAKNDNTSLHASLNWTMLILCLVVLILFTSVLGISYRIYGIVKRRNYISDEIELLDTRLQKWNNYI